MKKFMLAILSIVIIASLLFSGCTKMEPVPDNLKFMPAYFVDYPYYDTMESLANKATDIYKGKVTDVFFDILDMFTGEPVDYENQPYSSNWELTTIYEITVKASYKGANAKKMYVRVMGGMDSYKAAEQYTVMKAAGMYKEQQGIPLIDSFEHLQPGQTYIFFTASKAGPYDSIVNPEQFAYSEDRQLDKNFTYDEIKAYVEALS